MSAEARSIPRRAALTALNLLQPGLGIVRTGRGRAALLFLLAPHAALLLLIGLYAALPTLSFAALTASVLLILAAGVAIYLGSMALTWRWSLLRPASPARGDHGRRLGR